MSSFSPPNPNVDIYNALYWVSADGFITESFANKHYLKFPTAQGTETMKNTIFNGTIIANQPATFNDSVLVDDGQSLNFNDTNNLLSGSMFGFTTGLINSLYIANPSTGYVIVKSNNINTATFGSTQSTFSTPISVASATDTIELVPTPTAGYLNPIVSTNSPAIISTGSGAGFERLTLTTWGTMTTGIQIAGTSCFMGAGGAGLIPTSYIDFNGSINQISVVSANPPTSNATQPASNDSTTKMPTTAWVQTAVTGGSSALLASNNSWTGTNTFSNLFSLTNANPPTSSATQPAFNDSTTKMPTTAWVQTAVTGGSNALLGSNNSWSGTNAFSNLFSLTNVNPPTSSATQPASNDSTTKIPTTAWVQTAVSSGLTSLLTSNNSWSGTNTFSNLFSLTNANPPTSSATQPAFNDSSTKMPTTAWVQTAIAGVAPPTSFVPVGSVIAWGGFNTPPSGWLFCNGASVSTTTYAALFAVFGGYAYGGSGGFFLLPSMFSGTGKGTMAVCSSTISNSGVILSPSVSTVMSGGNQTISATQIPSHSHTIAYSSGTNFAQGINFANNTTTGGSSSRGVGTQNGALPTTTGATPVGEDYLPPFVAFAYIIKT